MTVKINEPTVLHFHPAMWGYFRYHSSQKVYRRVPVEDGVYSLNVPVNHFAAVNVDTHEIIAINCNTKGLEKLRYISGEFVFEPYHD